MARNSISKSNSYCTIEFGWEIVSSDLNTMEFTMAWDIYIIPKIAIDSVAFSSAPKIDGVECPSVVTTATAAANTRVLIGTGTAQVYGEGDVIRTIPVIVITGDSSPYTVPTIDDDITLPNIIPKATFVTVPASITDEVERITIGYNVPDASKMSTLRLGVKYDANADMTFITIDKNASSYTINVTEAQRELIRQSRNYRASTYDYWTISYQLESTINGQVYTVGKISRVTFVNAEPSISATIVDVNTAMTELTGNANVLVKGYSHAEVTVVTTAKKHAYIESEIVENGTQKLDYGTGVFYNIENGNFIITVKDSRKFTSTETVTKQVIDYIPLTCNMIVDIPSTDGSTTVRLSGNCFYGSFGRTSNTLTLAYRYQVEGGSYSSWQTATATIQSDNTYAVNYNITGLDYTKAYTFEAYAMDKIETIYSVEIKVKSTPVFDWGENDFNFNVPVNFSQGFTQPLSALKQLWNGQQQMADSSTSINLIEPISQQANGIVLIFTPYNSTTGLANDEKLQSFFVSKKVVQVMPSKMHTFMLIDGGNFATVGAKSLYIADAKITGYANNNTSGGASNSTGSIRYDNTKFVLRYVLGV